MLKRINLNMPGDRAAFEAGGKNTLRVSATDRGLGTNWTTAVLTVRGYVGSRGGVVTIATISNTDQGTLMGPYVIPSLDRVEVVVTTPQSVTASTELMIDVEALLTAE